MLRFLRTIFMGHNHVWDVPFHRSDVYEDEDSPRPYKIVYTCRCKTCGVIKKFSA